MSELSQEKKSSLLSDRTYDVLKKIVMVVLPGIGTLYFALAQIWNLPKAEEVVGSITAVSTFIGVTLGISARSYNNGGGKYVGEINIEDDGEAKRYSLVMNGDPESIDGMTEATFKVNGTGDHPIVKS